MLSKAKNNAVVGLDVQAGSVAATEVILNGGAAVAKYGTAPLGADVFSEGEVSDPEALGDALKELFSQHKLSRNVRVGLASQRVAVRTLHLPPIEDRELDIAIRSQAQEHIPMPLEQAVLDWQVVGHSTAETGESRVEVVAVAARRDMLSGLMGALTRAGLRPVGIDLSAFGMIRALAGESHTSGDSAQASSPETAYEERISAHLGGAEPAVPGEGGTAQLYCNLGDVTNLAVARSSTCLFTRVSPFGLEGIAQKLAERQQLTLEHARQWLVHVGIEQPLEAIEGDPQTVSAARDTLAEGAARLVDELRLSLEYYGAQEGAVPIERIVACGPGTTIPGLTSRLQHDLGYPFEVGAPRALAHLDRPTAARLTLSFGLALEE